MVHTFSALGCNIAVDVNSGAVHVLDQLSYDLLHAAGQFAGTFILKAFQTIVGQKLFHIVGTLFGKSMMDLQSQSDILVDGTPFEEMIVLQHIADTGIVKGSVGIVDYDGAGLRSKQSRNDRQQRGLPAAAGTY